MAAPGPFIKAYVADLLNLHIPSDPHIPPNPINPSAGIKLILALQNDSSVELLGVLPPSDIG
jgi:hypothetical protein